MTKMIRETVDLDLRWTIEGMTARELEAHFKSVIAKVPEQYRDVAKVTDVGYDDPMFELHWERPQTESERQKEERDQREKVARAQAEQYARDKATFERLKAKFEPNT